MRFLKVNKKDGSLKTCKFCHAHVWWHQIESRWYGEGGKTLHVENCEKAKEYYHNQALDNQEKKRGNQ